MWRAHFSLFLTSIIDICQTSHCLKNLYNLRLNFVFFCGPCAILDYTVKPCYFQTAALLQKQGISSIASRTYGKSLSSVLMFLVHSTSKSLWMTSFNASTFLGWSVISNSLAEKNHLSWQDLIVHSQNCM